MHLTGPLGSFAQAARNMATAHEPISKRDSHNATDFATDFPYSTGLSGLDQKSDYLLTHIFIGILCAVILLTLILRWSELWMARVRRISVIAAPHRQVFWSRNGNRWWPWLKKHLIYAPLFRLRHNREWQLSKAVSFGTVPSRGHMILLVALIAVNVAFCLALPYSESTDIILVSFRVRTGWLSVIHMVPCVLFALRNNPLLWFLRTTYDTFNYLHRHVGRLAGLHAVLHTLAWCVSTSRTGGFGGISRGLSELPHGPSYVAGLVGTVCFVVIGIQAWSPLRHACYEVFLTLHKVLAIATIIGVYLHLSIDGLPQLSWIQACVAFLVYEYAARLFRIVRHNFCWREGVTMLTIEALDGEACRITAHLIRSWRPCAGIHAQVYVPSFSLWSSHPFSVAWSSVDNKMNEKSDLELTDFNAVDPEAQKGQPSESEAYDMQKGRVKGTVSFITRARSGMTLKMFEAANRSPNRKITTWGLVEGPYGSKVDFTSYGTLLLFAGGVGITHLTSHIRDLIHGAHNGLNGCKKIVLVWSVPSTEALEWIRPWMDEILRMPGRREILTIKLFVTRPRNKNEIKSGSGSVAMYPGRCTPQKEVDAVLRDRQGAMGVTVCGPGAFSDDVRQAVRARVDEAVIDFIEEAFTY